MFGWAKLRGIYVVSWNKTIFDVICMQEVMASDDVEMHLSRLCFDRSQIIKASRLPYSFFSPNWSSKIADGSFKLGNLILSRPIIEENSDFIVHYPRGLIPAYKML